MSSKLRPTRRFYPLVPSNLASAMLGGWKMADEYWDNFWEKGLLPEKASMRADIKETDTAYILEAELPGYKKENINVEYTDGRLDVSATKEQEIKVEKRNYLKQERYYGEVSRRFRVQGIKEEEISAVYQAGVLTVSMPKSEPTVAAKKTIDIK